MKNYISKLIKIIDRLRGKNGCPWDKKQNFKSVRENLLEETYEAIEAINIKNFDKLKEELGDILIQIVFLARIANEKKIFNFNEIVKSAVEKLIRRHPHIFGNIKVKTTKEVLKNWEQIKQNEENKKYVLSSIPLYLPALLKAKKVQNKVARVGFDWGKVEGPVKKLKEEISEFFYAIKTNRKKKVEEEIGDILFTIVNIARFYHINPEEALNKTIKKFIKRFNYIEDSLRKKGKKITESNLKEMDYYWEKAKIK